MQGAGLEIPECEVCVLGGFLLHCSSHGHRTGERKRKRRVRGRLAWGLGALAPGAGPGQLQGHSGREKRGVTPEGPPVPSLCAQPGPSPSVPVALSSLGRNRFQKAQACACSPCRTSSGLRFRLTYCCVSPEYCGHCESLGSGGLLGFLRKGRKSSVQVPGAASPDLPSLSIGFTSHPFSRTP